MAIAGAVLASAAGWGYLAPFMISCPLGHVRPCVNPKDSVKAVDEVSKQLIDKICQASPKRALLVEATYNQDEHAWRR